MAVYEQEQKLGQMPQEVLALTAANVLIGDMGAAAGPQRAFCGCSRRCWRGT